MQLRLFALLGLVALVASLCAGRTAPSSSSPLRLDSPALSSPDTPSHPVQNKRGTHAEEHELAIQVDPVGLAQQDDAASFSQAEETALDSNATPRRSHKRKRCIYIGTFFHAIDCNAPVNSTQVPYAPLRKPEQTTTAAAATRSGQAQVVSTGLVTRTRAKVATATSAVEGG
ncbi:hypothetical protein JCM8208_003552 [Rhodotorula glutinis]